ncbi:MAG: STAS domain-containing protein [Pseudomonadales bacterium]|nr:STAS domain-containing protein [Pseudomonadales bacterium]
MANHTPLSVPSEEHDKAVILCPAGRVDGTNVAILQGAVRERLDAGQTTVVFDLVDLNYISSAGLRVFLMAARDLQRHGGKALFCGLSEQIMQVFEITGFDKILSVHGTRDEALGAI